MSDVQLQGTQRDLSLLGTAAGATLTNLRNTPPRFRDTLLALRKQLFQIAGDKMISALAAQQQNQAARQKALDAIDADFRIAESNKNDLEKRIAEAFALPNDPTARLLRLTEQQQAWTRVERLLTGGTGYEEVIQQAGERGDLVTLQALREELPSYLFAAKWQDDYTKALLKLIAQAELPLLTPEQRTARLLEAELSTGWYNLTMGAEHARLEASGQWETVTVLPAWEKGTTIPVVERIPGV